MIISHSYQFKRHDLAWFKTGFLSGVILTLFCLCLIQSSLFSQTENNAFDKISINSGGIVFSNITEKDGLSDNKIMDILIDHDGLLWIGTFTGLNRYDGKRFEIFTRKKTDPQGLSHNLITCLHQDHTGNIWIGTENGLHIYDKIKHRIFAVRDTSRNESFRVNCITSTPDGKIWFGSDIGLISYQHHKGVFRYFVHDPDDKNSLSDHKIYKKGITYDEKNNGLWIATQKGLQFFNPSTGKVKNYFNESDTTFYTKHNISALHLSKSGILWYLDIDKKEIVGNDPILKKVLHRLPVSPHIKNAYGGSIFETSQHEIWFSSNSYETVRMTYKKPQRTIVMQHNPAVSTSIPGDYVAAMVEDKDKTVWLGTIAGLARYHPERQYYRVDRVSEQFPELNGNWQITCLAENPKNGDRWIGTRDDIIYIHHVDKSVWVKHDVKKYRKDRDPKFIIDIEFVEDRVVLSFVKSFPMVFDPQTKKLTPLFQPRDFPPNYQIRLLAKETDTTYLIGNSLPIIRWKPSDNSFQRIKINRKNGMPDFQDAGWLTSRQNLGSWLAFSNNDIGHILPGDTLINVFPLPIGAINKQSGYFNSLSIDHKGNAWFTFSGQGLFHAKKKIPDIAHVKDIEWQKWDINDGIFNEVLLSVIEDKFGRIWSTSFNKFSVYNPSKQEFFNFKIPLSENNSFYYNYVVPMRNGHIMTNIKGDLVTFFPSSLKTLRPSNNLIFSILQTNNKKIYLEKASSVTLEPNENFITIGFGSLSSPEDFQYQFEYKLNDIQEDWVASGKECQATYTDLSPGTYEFKLRAVSGDGLWASPVKTLRITIKAPFYNTWWFLLIMMLITLALVGYMVRSRMKSIDNMNALRTKTQLLEKEKTTVMYENLKQHLNPHFLFNSLTSLSSLIRLDPSKAQDFLDKMSKVYRYILKNKDNETVPISEELNFVKMYVQLQKTRFEKGFSVMMDLSEEHLTQRIVPVTLQNLIENAIKHNTADEESPLVVEIFANGDYLVVRNNLQKKNFVETSNKQGQQSMVSLYRFLSPLPVLIDEDNDYYTVQIPFI